MNVLFSWLQNCSDCFQSTHENSWTSHRNHSDLKTSSCLHDSNRKDRICYKCFLTYFGHDRFIIRRLFIYLNRQQRTDFVYLTDLHSFAEQILNWHEIMNHSDFILLMFRVAVARSDAEPINTKSFTHDDDLFEKISLESRLFYRLIEDAFFFSALQSNTQHDLTQASRDFLEKFSTYFSQLNQTPSCKMYIKSIKFILPWGFSSIHKWFKHCFSSSITKLQSRSVISNEFSSNLPLAFLWYLTNWLTSNKVFLNEHDPIVLFEKVARQELITNVYDSDMHGYSIVTLCESTYDLEGPFLFMIYCNDERRFAILLEGNLMDSAKSYGGRSSLCFQLSPRFLILERGPSMFYWNIKKRSDGPLGIYIGHNGVIRVSFDLDMEFIRHPDGSSSINRLQVYKFGLYKTAQANPTTHYQSFIRRQQHNEYNVFSVDAHKLAESIGIHLFT